MIWSEEEALRICKDFENKEDVNKYDIDEYIDALTLLSARDNLDAITTLGSLYYEGRFVEQNFGIAKFYYEKGVKLGSIPCTLYLGYVYYYGRGMDKPNYKKAYECFTKIGLLPSTYRSEALYKISDMFLNGYSVKKDFGYAEALIAPLLYTENEKAGEFEYNVLGDILIRLVRFTMTKLEQEGSDIQLYRLWKYVHLAKLVISERFDGVWFGDKFLLEELDKDVELLNTLIQDTVSEDYSKCDINNPLPRGIKDFFNMTSYWECRSYIVDVIQSENGKDAALYFNCHNEYASFPEVGYVGRVDKLVAVLKNVQLELINYFDYIDNIDFFDKDQLIEFMQEKDKKFIIRYDDSSMAFIRQITRKNADGTVDKIEADDFDTFEFESHDQIVS